MKKTFRTTEKVAPAVVAFRSGYEALRSELFNFSFHYPLFVDPDVSRAQGLGYPLYSDSLSWSALRMDVNGVPMVWTRTTGTNYWAGYIAWYALVQLGHYIRGKGAVHLDHFLTQIKWLEKNAVRRDDGAVVWQMAFDYQEEGVLLRAPWVSAHVQGLAISALVRGWRLTRRPELLSLLKDAGRIFALNVEDRGIRATSGGFVFYTEVPGGPTPGILDGFMTSLVGLYDLSLEVKDTEIRTLLEDGVSGLRGLLPFWDYRSKWSWYGHRQYLAPPAYHCLNRLLLGVLGDIFDAADLRDRAAAWDPANLTKVDAAEIYVAVTVTKNLFRLRRRTWQQQTIPESMDASKSATAEWHRTANGAEDAGRLKKA